MPRDFGLLLASAILLLRVTAHRNSEENEPEEGGNPVDRGNHSLLDIRNESLLESENPSLLESLLSGNKSRTLMAPDDAKLQLDDPPPDFYDKGSAPSSKNGPGKGQGKGKGKDSGMGGAGGEADADDAKPCNKAKKRASLVDKNPWYGGFMALELQIEKLEYMMYAVEKKEFPECKDKPDWFSCGLAAEKCEWLSASQMANGGAGNDLNSVGAESAYASGWSDSQEFHAGQKQTSPLSSLSPQPQPQDLNGDGRVDMNDDLNRDGVVDDKDAAMAANQPLPLSVQDLNGDGKVDSSDDLNSDGVVDRKDLQMKSGTNGWDLNGDGQVNMKDDLNHDGLVDAKDLELARGPQNSSPMGQLTRPQTGESSPYDEAKEGSNEDEDFDGHCVPKGEKVRGADLDPDEDEEDEDETSTTATTTA